MYLVVKCLSRTKTTGALYRIFSSWNKMHNAYTLFPLILWRFPWLTQRDNWVLKCIPNMMIIGFSAVNSLYVIYMFRLFRIFVLFLLTIVLSVLRFMASDYPFGSIFFIHDAFIYVALFIWGVSISRLCNPRCCVRKTKSYSNTPELSRGKCNCSISWKYWCLHNSDKILLYIKVFRQYGWFTENVMMRGDNQAQNPNKWNEDGDNMLLPDLQQLM